MNTIASPWQLAHRCTRMTPSAIREILKLTAPAEVATLQALVGRQAELDGRKLYLATVTGPVLVVDKVLSYKPL